MVAADCNDRIYSIGNETHRIWSIMDQQQTGKSYYLQLKSNLNDEGNNIYLDARAKSTGSERAS